MKARSGLGTSVVVVAVVLCFAEIAVTAPAPERYFGFDQSAMRVFRRRGEPVKTGGQSNAQRLDCPYDVITQPGEYYIDQSHGQLCTWLFIAGADAVVELELVDVELPCVDDTLIQFFDGVALGVGIFPTEEDHLIPTEERINMVCDTGSQTLAASQNVAMLTYQSAASGGAFRLVVKHKTITSPCNVFNAQMSGDYTLSNFGKERNCSYVSVFPGYVTVLHMAVGQETNEARLKCKTTNDRVSFLEGNTVDITKMNAEQQMCGRTGMAPAVAERDRTPAVEAPAASGGFLTGREEPAVASLAYETGAQCTSGINIPLMCRLSMVRLVSSGLYDNSVTFLFTRDSNGKDECSVF